MYRENRHFVIIDWGCNHIVGRFSTLENAEEYRKEAMKSYQTWTIYQEIL